MVYSVSDLEGEAILTKAGSSKKLSQQMSKFLRQGISPSKLILVALVWIIVVILIRFTGLYFTSYLPNLLVNASAITATEVIIILLLFCRIPTVLKMLWLPICLLSLLLFSFTTLLFVYDFGHAVKGIPSPLHRVICSEKLGKANLVVYDDDFGGGTASSSSYAELEKPFLPGLKIVEPVGSGGDRCGIELSRVDDHHIRVVATWYAVEPPEILSDIVVTDL